jgi:hypothetical protein
MLRRRYFVQSVKCSSLPTDRNETYIQLPPIAWKVTFLKFQRNPINSSEMLRRRYFVQQVKCPSLPTDRNGTIPLSTSSWKVKFLKFQRHAMNSRRGASKKVLCTISKVPFLFDRSLRQLHRLMRMVRNGYV